VKALKAELKDVTNEKETLMRKTKYT